jgi:glycosyltransferase involved in cell wall biosynthesis
MRVLQLGSPTGLYGAERWILALVKHLDRARVESIVAVINDDPTLKPALCDNASLLGLRTHTFHAYGRLSLSAISQVRRFITEHEIHILHSHGYKSDLIGLLAVQGTRCKIICTPHGWHKNSTLRLRLYEILDRRLLRFFDAVAPLSPELYERLQGLPGTNGKVKLVENGVDLDEIDRITAIATDVQSWKNGNYFVIGYVGRLVASKGLEILLKAFARLKHRNVRLAIVGDGQQIGELKELADTLQINEYVRFFGYREDRLAFLKGFDLFVLPSRTEGTPRCAMEAMAAGVPVIVTDIPGCRVLVEDSVHGLLFKVDDEVGLAKCITTLLEDVDLRNSLSFQARHLITANFSAGNMANRYLELFDSVLKSRGSTK